MTLLIDVGNTRLKWRWLDGTAPCNTAGVDGTLPLAEAGLPDAANAPGVAQTLADLMGAIRPGGGAARGLRHEALIACVADDGVARAVTKAAMLLGCTPHRLLASAAACDVRNAYAEPELLGVDRWLGLIAVRAQGHGATCVVGVGTALTVDLLDGAGQHQGGLIVPGPELMRDVLVTRTARIGAAARRALPRVEGGLGVNTAGAMREGSLLAAAALATRAAEDFALRVGESVTLVLTGGGAAEVADRLPAMRPSDPLGIAGGCSQVGARSVQPDLVLQGLAQVAACRARGDQVAGCVTPETL